MDFNIKDFEALGDKIEKQEKVIKAYEAIVNGLVLHSKAVDNLANYLMYMLPNDIKKSSI